MKEEEMKVGGRECGRARVWEGRDLGFTFARSLLTTVRLD